MSSNLSLSAFFLVIVVCSAARSTTFRLDGHVTHGINTFNNEQIVDLSDSSNIFGGYGRIHEVGLLNPGGANGSIVSKHAPLSSLMATIDAVQLQQALGLPQGAGPFNVPLARTGVISGGATNINDRVKTKRFAASSKVRNIGSPYLSAGVDTRITLRDWNRASGSVVGTCKGAYADVEVKVKNGHPNALYTMWDAGVLKPLTSREEFSYGPFGGLPNVITTDEHGMGSAKRRLNYCPFRKCAKAARCTIYISLFYHFDHMVYGGFPSMDTAGPAVGNIGANHVQFFANGIHKIRPQNPY